MGPPAGCSTPSSRPRRLFLNTRPSSRARHQHQSGHTLSLLPASSSPPARVHTSSLATPRRCGTETATCEARSSMSGPTPLDLSHGSMLPVLALLSSCMQSRKPTRPSAGAAAVARPGPTEHSSCSAARAHAEPDRAQRSTFLPPVRTSSAKQEAEVGRIVHLMDCSLIPLRPAAGKPSRKPRRPSSSASGTSHTSRAQRDARHALAQDVTGCPPPCSHSNGTCTRRARSPCSVSRVPASAGFVPVRPLLRSPSVTSTAHRSRHASSSSGRSQAHRSSSTARGPPPDPPLAEPGTTEGKYDLHSLILEETWVEV